MASYTSIATGSWAASATWGGGPPGDGDTATIDTGTVVTIDSDVTIGTTPNDTSTYVVTINDGATLKWDDNPYDDWTLTVKGNINIEHGASGGVFQVGSVSNPIPSDRVATVHFPVDLGSASYWRIYNAGGVVRMHGASAYHMADVTNQRTKIASTVTAGASATLLVQDAVDWQVGDEIWIGTGATADPTDCEKTTILGKNSTTEYIVTITENHVIGDHIVHAARNLVLRGGSTTQTVRIINLEQDSGGVTYLPIGDIRWVRMENAGDAYNAAAIVYQVNASEQPELEIPEENFVVDSVVLATPEDVGGVFIDVDLNFESATAYQIQNFHHWQGTRSIYVLAEGDVNIRYNSNIGARGSSVYSREGKIRIDNMWVSGRTSSFSASYGVYGFVKSLENSELFNLYRPYYISNTGGGAYFNEEQIGTEEGLISNCKFYYSNDDSLFISNDYMIKLVTEDCTFLKSNDRCVYCAMPGTFIFRTCTFDGALMSHPANRTSGAVGIRELTGHIKFENCDFGYTVANWERNISLDSSAARTGKGRLLVEGCRFIKPDTDETHSPTEVVPSPDPSDSGYWYCSYPMYWIAWVGDTARWSSIINWSREVSLEFVDVHAYDSVGGTDYWTDMYGTQRVAVLGGRGEMRSPAPIQIDGTFSTEFRPFNEVVDTLTTESVPIKILLEEDQEVTVTLDLRYLTAPGESYRALGGKHLPSINIRGPGFYDSSSMTSISTSWERLTVTGTANYTGVVEFWVTAGGARHLNLKLDPNDYFAWFIDPTDRKYSYSFSDWNSYSPPPQREQVSLYVYSPAAMYYDTDNMWEYIVYADRLRIMVT
jgi:hypothetical protein